MPLRVIMIKMVGKSNVLDIKTVTDLRSFFYEGLTKINKQSLSPVSESLLLYSSDVLQKYAHSYLYFNEENGKVSEKTLGLNILQAESMNKEEKRKIYKDVGDTALVLVGYFPKSINAKLLDKSYYIQIGQMAYKKMDYVYPDYLDIPSFYKKLADCFEGLTHLLHTFSQANFQDPYKHFLLNECSDQELLVNGILPNHSKKVS